MRYELASFTEVQFDSKSFAVIDLLNQLLSLVEMVGGFLVFVWITVRLFLEATS